MQSALDIASYSSKFFNIFFSPQEKEANSADLAFGTGPIVSSLEKVLSKFNVQRQAYHGKAFVGNHVHKCCKVIHIRFNP